MTFNTQSYFNSIVLSFFSAVGITLFLNLLKGLADGHLVAFVIIKYSVLGVALFWGLARQKQQLGQGYYIFDGLRFGAFVSLITGVFIGLINLFLFFIYPDLAYDRFIEKGDSLNSVLIISIVLICETLIIGTVLTMILLLRYIERNRKKF